MLELSSANEAVAGATTGYVQFSEKIVLLEFQDKENTLHISA